MEGVLNGYVTNPNPTPTLTPNPNRNPNSNPNQINEKIQKETTLEIDQITKCQFGRWKLVKTLKKTSVGSNRQAPRKRGINDKAIVCKQVAYSYLGGQTSV
jgi:hypothetical protein